LPLHWQDDAFATIRKNGVGEDRLSLVHSKIAEHVHEVENKGTKYDIISLSNIADWMTDAQIEELIQTVSRVLKSGGFLLMRKALAGPSTLVQLMEKHLRVDPVVNAQVSAAERSMFWHEISVGFKET